MLLAVDIGNTETAFGLFSGENLLATWRFATSLGRTADEYVLLVESALRRQGFAPTEVSDMIVATASAQFLSVWEAVSQELISKRPLVVGPGIKTKLKIRFEPPTELSGDRIANAVAAYHLYGGGPAIVVDFGTATVFDVISEQGEYLGGAVAPGLAVMADALSRRAARIPRVEFAVPATAIGRNSAHALQSGLIFGHLDLVNGMISRLRREIGKAKVIATGDAAVQFSQLTNQLEMVVPHLSLHGLRLLHQINA